jgi:hypothetical protein
MIDPANEIVRDLIQSRLPALAGPSQVGFEPPNDDWRMAVVAASEQRVNLYLYDVRENLTLRTNERLREHVDGWLKERWTSPRLDCQYLVTAWSPASFSPPIVEPTRDEHLLLYEVLEVLMRHRPLGVDEVYRPGVTIPSGRTIASVPAPLREHPLPVDVAMPNGPSEIGEFWMTMKVVWKTALRLTVTVPVILLEDDFEAPAVTTIRADYRQGALAATAEALLTIGGRVTRGATAEPVRGAWVQILGLDPPEIQFVNRRLVTGADGRFVFSALRPGRYRLRAVASGLGDQPRDVDVPSETGEYDVRFP